MRFSLRLPRPVLQLRDACPGAVFVLLRGAASNAAGALDDTVADDRDGALAHDHLAAGRGGNAARGRLVRPLAHLATGSTEGRRGDSLALAAIGARPDR